MVDPFEGKLGTATDDELLRAINNFRAVLRSFTPKTAAALADAEGVLGRMADEVKRRNLKVSE